MATRGRPRNDAKKALALKNSTQKSKTTGRRPKKTSTEAKLPSIAGSIEHVDQADQATAILETFAPPAWLDDRDAATWREIVPTLRARRLFAASDVIPFARYCRLLGAYLDLCEASIGRRSVRTERKSVGKGTIEKVSASFKARMEIEKLLLSYEDRFAMSPRERVNVMEKIANAAGRVPPAPPEAPNPQPQAAAQPEKRGPVGFLMHTPPPTAAKN